MGSSVGAQGDGVAVESPQGDHVPGDQPDRPRLPRRSATASSPCGRCGPTTSTRWSSWCGTRRRCGRRPRRSLTSATTPRRPAPGLARAPGGVGRRRPGRRPDARPHQRLPARRRAEPHRWRDRLLGTPRRPRARRRRGGPRPRGGTRVHARVRRRPWPATGCRSAPRGATRPAGTSPSARASRSSATSTPTASLGTGELDDGAWYELLRPGMR